MENAKISIYVETLVLFNIFSGSAYVMGACTFSKYIWPGESYRSLFMWTQTCDFHEYLDFQVPSNSSSSESYLKFIDKLWLTKQSYGENLFLEGSLGCPSGTKFFRSSFCFLPKLTLGLNSSKFFFRNLPTSGSLMTWG